MLKRRWAVRIHKWVALIVGVQVFLWIAGGLVMSAIPIEKVRGEHKITEAVPLILSPTGIITLSDAAKLAGEDQIIGATLGQLLEAPVWRLETADGIKTIHALSGELISPVSETLARAIALSDYSGQSDIGAIQIVESPPTEYGRSGPVWRVSFSDDDKTTLYIDPFSAKVTARRSFTWRFYDFFWKLHVMDYDDGENFNHPLLVTAAGAALFLALSGLFLLVIRTRQSLRKWGWTIKAKPKDN